MIYIGDLKPKYLTHEFFSIELQLHTCKHKERHY